MHMWATSLTCNTNFSCPHIVEGGDIIKDAMHATWAKANFMKMPLERGAIEVETAHGCVESPTSLDKFFFCILIGH